MLKGRVEIAWRRQQAVRREKQKPLAKSAIRPRPSPGIRKNRKSRAPRSGREPKRRPSLTPSHRKTLSRAAGPAPLYASRRSRDLGRRISKSSGQEKVPERGHKPGINYVCYPATSSRAKEDILDRAIPKCTRSLRRRKVHGKKLGERSRHRPRRRESHGKEFHSLRFPSCSCKNQEQTQPGS